MCLVSKSKRTLFKVFICKEEGEADIAVIALRMMLEVRLRQRSFRQIFAIVDPFVFAMFVIQDLKRLSVLIIGQPTYIP